MADTMNGHPTPVPWRRRDRGGASVRVVEQTPAQPVPAVAPAELAEVPTAGEPHVPMPPEPQFDPVAVAVVHLLETLGVPRSEHTADTPGRVAQAWRHALRGYWDDPRQHLERTFPGEPGAPLVVQTGIHMVSTCAHHLLPIVGTATVAYRPQEGARIVGLSKLARVVEGYAARATVQEHIGHEVANALAEVLDTEGAACVITAEHGCMSLRGISQPAARTTTTSLAGGWDARHPDVAYTLDLHRIEVGRR